MSRRSTSRAGRSAALPALILALGLAAAGCGGCKEKAAPPEAPPSPLAFFPPRPQGLVAVRDLAALGATVKALEGTKLAELAAIAAGESGTEAFARPVVAQLGFDPRTAEGFATVGVDGAKGLAFGNDEQGVQLLAIGVGDTGRFEAYVAALAQKLGAPARKEVALPTGGTVVTFSTEGEAPAVGLAYAVKDGFGLVAVREGAVDALSRALARPRAQSLAQSAEFDALGKRLGERDVIVWAPPGTPAPALEGSGRRARTLPEEGLAIGVRASRAGVNARVVLPQSALGLAVLEATGRTAGGELVPLLPEKTLLAARLGGEPGSLKPLLERVLPRRLQKRLEKAGFELERDVLAQLKPGVVVGVGLQPELNLSGGLPGDVSLSTFNPFQFVHLTLIAKVKDPAATGAVLERLSAAGETFGMTVAAREEEGARVFTASYAAGEGMTWGLVGDTLLATGGAGQFARARARVAKAEPPFSLADPAAKQGFDTAASAAHLEMPRLVGALRAIPESAYGVGGFRIKEIMDTWTAMLDEVKGVTAAFSVQGDALVVDADLGLK